LETELRIIDKIIINISKSYERKVTKIGIVDGFSKSRVLLKIGPYIITIENVKFKTSTGSAPVDMLELYVGSSTYVNKSFYPVGNNKHTGDNIFGSLGIDDRSVTRRVNLIQIRMGMLIFIREHRTVLTIGVNQYSINFNRNNSFNSMGAGRGDFRTVVSLG
jgi:hypothetical protein